MNKSVSIKQVEIYPTGLDYKTEFHISRGKVGSPSQKAPHIFIKIITDDGSYGWGEARPSHYWSYETAETVITTLSRYLGPLLIGKDISSRELIDSQMNREIAPGFIIGQPIAKSAIDMALWDLTGKQQQVNLQTLFEGELKKELALSYLVSSLDEEEAYQIASKAKGEGYQGFKVKIGMKKDIDIAIVRAVKSAIGDAFLWVDANEGYDLKGAIALSQALAEIGVQVLEQPLPASDILSLKELTIKSEVPVALDESVFSPLFLNQLISLDAIKMLVIKVSKLGGITNALKTIQIAREHGIELLGSGLTESHFGLAASGQLYAACSFAAPVDLNGPQFIAQELVTNPLIIKNGTVTLPQGIGIGLDLSLDKLNEYTWQDKALIPQYPIIIN